MSTPSLAITHRLPRHQPWIGRWLTWLKPACPSCAGWFTVRRDQIVGSFTHFRCHCGESWQETEY